MDDGVVITGTGIVCSLGNSMSDVWKALLSNKCGIRPIEGFDAQGFDCRMAAQVNLTPSDLNIHPRDARIMDKHSLMLMKCSRDAFKESKLGTASIAGEDIGFFAGMGMVDYKIEDLLPAVSRSLDRQGNLNYNAFFSKGYQEIYPLWPLSMLNNISFCQVAIDLGVKGENTVFSPHSDSGMQAIAEAAKTVIDKKAKVALAGGVSEKVSPMSLARASLVGILNTGNKNPSLKKGDIRGFLDGMLCRPFGEDRKGTILGEGCGIVALELYSSVKERDVPCLAVLTGYGFAFGISEESHCPTVSAMSRAMKLAINNAKINPSDIDVIIAHGDGTYLGDENEIEAIHRVFAGCIDKVNVFSSKGALGHLLSGASAVDVILGIQMLQNGIIPAVSNAAQPDKSIKFNLVKEPVKANVTRVLINSFSYEGQCASLIIEKTE